MESITEDYVRLQRIANIDFNIDNSLVHLKQLMDERQKIANFLIAPIENKISGYNQKELQESLKYIELNIKQLLNLE